MTDDERFDRHEVVCNYIEGTSIVAEGARAYVVLQLGGNLPERVRVVVRSRGGRWVSKWENMRRLDNFRLTTIPPEHPRYSDERLWGGATPDHVARLVRARAELLAGGS